MRTRALPVIIIAAVAVVLVAMLGAHFLHRDRTALVENYAADRQQLLEEAAQDMQDELADMSEDLELAATLLENAESTDAARELHAIATIKREYLVVYARTTDNEPITRVTAFDAPAGADELAHTTLDEVLARAWAQPGPLFVSNALGPAGQPSAWYRVFARRSTPTKPAVAVAVDTAILLQRMKLVRDAASRVVIVDAAGNASPRSDRALAASLEVTRPSPALANCLAQARAGHTCRTRVNAEAAERAGLPRAVAVAVAVPLVVDSGPPWALVMLASTQAIETQERTIVQRVLVGSAGVLVLLLGAAAYVIRSSYRARSLSERLRVEQRLLLSEKLVTAGQLAAGIAHEVGTPLNVARGRVELTLSHLGEGHAEANNQKLVIDQIDRVTRLLQQLLDYVRPAPAVVRDVDVGQTLTAVVELLGPQAHRRGVALAANAPADLPALRGDPDQVQQIVMNLVMNAIDACEKNGHVTLRAGVERGLRVTVTDDGHGIPRELQKQVFDPFFTTKKRGQGTGLGLWVVAQLVRAQQAEIDLNSTPGTGTTVTVTWPVTA